MPALKRRTTKILVFSHRLRRGQLGLYARGSWGRLGRLGNRDGELEVNYQAAFGRVFGLSVAAVEVNGAFGN